MYGVLRRRRRKRAELIDETDEAIYLVVRRAGGVPGKGKTKFWKRILDEVKPPRIKSWQGVRKRYCDMVTKKLPATEKMTLA